MYRGIMLFANASFTKKVRTIRNEIGLDGINQFTTPTITDNPETTYRAYGNIDKKSTNLDWVLNANLSWFNYIQKP